MKHTHEPDKSLRATLDNKPTPSKSPKSRQIAKSARPATSKGKSPPHFSSIYIHTLISPSAHTARLTHSHPLPRIVRSHTSPYYIAFPFTRERGFISLLESAPGAKERRGGSRRPPRERSDATGLGRSRYISDSRQPDKPRTCVDYLLPTLYGRHFRARALAPRR